MTLTHPNTITEHSIVIWIDKKKYQSIESLKNAFQPVLHLIKTIHIFSSIDELLDFLRHVRTEYLSLIVDRDPHEQDICLYQSIEMVNLILGVYILSSNSTVKTRSAPDRSKVKGIFQDLHQICDVIEQNHHSWRSRLSRTSLVASTPPIIDEIDSSFIHSKLITEIIVQFDYTEESKHRFFDFLLAKETPDCNTYRKIEEFIEHYDRCSPISSYTEESFVRPMVNDAFITHDYTSLIKMGLFIRDLQQRIAEIYQNNDPPPHMKLYRGHIMSKFDFDDMKERQGGLYGFTNFLSTSFERQVAIQFAHCVQKNQNIVGVLFEIEVEPWNSSAPFAILHGESFARGESEVLFGPHTIFRVGQFEQNSEHLWTVQLTLTDDHDERRNLFADSIRKEVRNLDAWPSLGIILYRAGLFPNAISVFEEMIGGIDQTDQDESKLTLAMCYNNVAVQHYSMENYSLARNLYQDAWRSIDRMASPDTAALEILYDNVGLVHYALGDYVKAMSSCQKSLNMRLVSIASKPEALFNSYSNLGKIHESKGDYVTALSYYKQAEVIEREYLSRNHPLLTTTYNNFAGIYCLMGDYSLSLSFYQKSLDTYALFLPRLHPLVAMAYNNVGLLSQLLGDYPLALYYYEEAMRIYQKISPANQWSLATLSSNMGVIYRLLGDHPKALEYHEKAFKIQCDLLSSDHPSLAVTYNNIGAVDQAMGHLEKALTNYQKALEIWKRKVCSNHSSLVIVHNNIGSIYDSMGDYEKARSFYETSIKMLEAVPIKNPLDLATVYNNLGETYRATGNFQQALSFCQKALDIENTSFPEGHPSSAVTLSNIAVALEGDQQFLKAEEFAQRALEIYSRKLDDNHIEIKEVREYIAVLRQKIQATSS